MTTSGSVGLTERLRRRIEEQGPLTFAEFMEAALYDPEAGFYTRSPVGEQGDFVTSPHVSPAFGTLVARQIEEFWDLLDRPDPFTVVEAGAGAGVLASQVLRALPLPVQQATRYIALERSAAARAIARSDRVEVASKPSEIRPGQVGCVIANELLDNLPFHRVRGTKNGMVELFVGFGDDRFVLTEGPTSSEDVARLAPPLRDGDEAAVNVEALRFVDEAATLLKRGYIWLIDYGWPSVKRGALVHGYRGHRVEDDVLLDPGSMDITAGVDFEALARHGRSRDLNVWGPVTQRDALMALGYREWERQALTDQTQSLSERRGMEAARVFSDRNRARMLVDPSGLGAFLVVCFGVGADRPPRSMRGAG